MTAPSEQQPAVEPKEIPSTAPSEQQPAVEPKEIPSTAPSEQQPAVEPKEIPKKPPRQFYLPRERFGLPLRVAFVFSFFTMGLSQTFVRLIVATDAQHALNLKEHPAPFGQKSRRLFDEYPELKEYHLWKLYGYLSNEQYNSVCDGIVGLFEATGEVCGLGTVDFTWDMETPDDFQFAFYGNSLGVVRGILTVFKERIERIFAFGFSFDARLPQFGLTSIKFRAKARTSSLHPLLRIQPKTLRERLRTVPKVSQFKPIDAPDRFWFTSIRDLDLPVLISPGTPPEKVEEYKKRAAEITAKYKAMPKPAGYHRRGSIIKKRKVISNQLIYLPKNYEQLIYLPKTSSAEDRIFY
jgi:hypothetical protein